MDVSSSCIEKYNSLCLHYEIIANSCYSNRRNMTHAISHEYRPYIIAALIVFDMQRKMGQGLAEKYSKEMNGFASSLDQVINHSKDLLLELEAKSIDNIDLEQHRETILDLYENFASNGNLDSQGHAFDVGATKILHFLHPALFPIVDSNSARVLREEFHVSYKHSGQPGYTGQRYIESMQSIQSFIRAQGNESLKLLEPNSPLTRIFDKLAFVAGAGL